jgi:ribosomal protein L12E/L44/L45/RPP1/RPP2
VANVQSAPGNNRHSLSDDDITSQRAVTRRSMLGVLGVGAGVAAAVAFGTADSVPAADADKAKDAKSKKKKAPPKEEADSD